MNAADVVERAAAIMEARGKCEGQREDRLGRVCTIGAMRRALIAEGFFDNWSAVGQPALRAIGRFIGGTPVEIPKWSDSNDQETVVAALRATAAILRAQESQPVAVNETVPA